MTLPALHSRGDSQQPRVQRERQVDREPFPSDNPSARAPYERAGSNIAVAGSLCSSSREYKLKGRGKQVSARITDCA